MKILPAFHRSADIPSEKFIVVILISDDTYRIVESQPTREKADKAQGILQSHSDKHQHGDVYMVMER